MPDTPKYEFNRKPRFSVNHIARYLSASRANQRETIIRESKFQKKIPVVAYDPSKRIMREFLAENTGNLSYFNDPIRRFETKRRREPDGWMRDEMKRNIEAFAAFKRTFYQRRARRYQFVSGPEDRAIRLEGVLINVRLDVSVTHTDDEEVTYSGGCVLFVARTGAARRDIDERLKAVAAMIHWSLEIADANIEVLPRLCMSFDVFDQKIIKAPTATDRLRSQISPHYSRLAADLSEASGIGRVDGGFRGGFSLRVGD